MLNLFGRKIKKVVGIDIGSQNIKVVELRRRKGDWLLSNYAIASLKGKSARDIDPKETGLIIKKILEKAGIATEDAVMSVPAYSTFLSLIKLPTMSDEELDEAVQFEANKYIPIPLSEVTLGWSHSGEEILLIAVPKSLSQRYVEIASNASLHLKALESETFSLARALVGEEKENTLLIDVGATSSNITLVQGGDIRLNRTIDKNSSIKDAVKGVIEETNVAIKKIVLAGGAVRAETKEDIKTTWTDIKLVEANPWREIAYPKILHNTVQELSSVLAGAVGLGRREV